MYKRGNKAKEDRGLLKEGIHYQGVFVGTEGKDSGKTLPSPLV